MMREKRNLLFIVAIGVSLFLSGYGMASLPQPGLDQADGTKARALTLQSEVRTLDGRVERRMFDLETGIREARVDGEETRARHMQERQELIQRKVLCAKEQENYRERISQAGDHVRNDRFGEAVSVLSSVRRDLYRTLDDIAAAEYVVILVPRVEALRDTWREQNSGSASSRTAETEAGYRQAVERFAAGDLSDALWTYRQLASDYEALIGEAG